MTHKLGRQKRIYNPEVPHMSSILAGRWGTVGPPPLSVDYLSAMPADLGMMLNDTLGDCTCAGVYHAIQVLTFNARHAMQTNPDDDVLSIYEAFCGYVDGDPSTDQGGVEQTVLGDWISKGIPTLSGANLLLAFFEVDPRNTTDIKRVIDECGVCYIGFNVPQNIMPDNAPPPKTWTVQKGAPLIGGHAVVMGKYDADTAGLISWGEHDYQMTWDFFNTYVDEAYAIVDADWIRATGRTPLGLNVSQLDAMMRSLQSTQFPMRL